MDLGAPARGSVKFKLDKVVLKKEKNLKASIFGAERVDEIKGEPKALPIEGIFDGDVE